MALGNTFWAAFFFGSVVQRPQETPRENFRLDDFGVRTPVILHVGDVKPILDVGDVKAEAILVLVGIATVPLTQYQDLIGGGGGRQKREKHEEGVPSLTVKRDRLKSAQCE